MSKYQRPNEIILGLRRKPVWDLSDLDQETIKMILNLQKNWQKILSEGIKLKEIESKWQVDEDVVEKGKWNQLEFIGMKAFIYIFVYYVIL